MGDRICRNLGSGIGTSNQGKVAFLFLSHHAKTRKDYLTFSIKLNSKNDILFCEIGIVEIYNTRRKVNS
jgi:hypothetical protein